LRKDAIATELTELVSATKAPSALAEWVGDNISDKQPMRRLAVPLGINGLLRSGLTLKIQGPRSVPPGRPFCDLTARIEATLDERLWHLGRIDFDPSGDPPHHRNKLNSMRFAPSEVAGTHHHPFAENMQIGVECFEPKVNLPVALPEIGDFRRYDEVLDLICTRFRIDGLWTEDPQWLLLLA
jgi:hypothetical protein